MLKGSVSMIAQVSWGRQAAIGVVLGVLVAALPVSGSAQEFMSEEEMLATLPGVQASGISTEGKNWAQVYSKRSGKKKNGKFNGVYDGAKYTGKWVIKDDQWCEETSDGWSGCFNFVHSGSNEIIAYRNGKKQNPWTIK